MERMKGIASQIDRSFIGFVFSHLNRTIYDYIYSQYKYSCILNTSQYHMVCYMRAYKLTFLRLLVVHVTHIKSIRFLLKKFLF